MTDSSPAVPVRSLLDLRRGERARIVALPPDPVLRSQCIRLGLTAGATVSCAVRLPGGTVVLETERQELALGRSLAGSITIESDTDAG